MQSYENDWQELENIVGNTGAAFVFVSETAADLVCKNFRKSRSIPSEILQILAVRPNLLRHQEALTAHLSCFIDEAIQLRFPDARIERSPHLTKLSQFYLCTDGWRNLLQKAEDEDLFVLLTLQFKDLGLQVGLPRSGHPCLRHAGSLASGSQSEIVATYCRALLNATLDNLRYQAHLDIAEVVKNQDWYKPSWVKSQLVDTTKAMKTFTYLWFVPPTAQESTVRENVGKSTHVPILYLSPAGTLVFDLFDMNLMSYQLYHTPGRTASK